MTNLTFFLDLYNINLIKDFIRLMLNITRIINSNILIHTSVSRATTQKYVSRLDNSTFTLKTVSRKIRTQRYLLKDT